MCTAEELRFAYAIPAEDCGEKVCHRQFEKWIRSSDRIQLTIVAVLFNKSPSDGQMGELHYLFLRLRVRILQTQLGLLRSHRIVLAPGRFRFYIQVLKYIHVKHAVDLFHA